MSVSRLQLNDVTTEKQSLTESILELTKGLSNNVIQYKDKDGNIITTTSSCYTYESLEKQLNDAKQQRDKLSIREEALTDSVTKIDLLKLELETNTDIASEIGPLKYIANITGKSIDQVVNWFIIALMLVFDPLAIALVIAANVVFSKPKDDTPPKPEGGLNDRPDVKRAMERASKLSEGHEIDEDEPTALAFTPYDDEEFDEEDALDQVLNNMVEEIEDEIPPLTEDDYLEPIKEDTDVLMLEDNWRVNNPNTSIESKIKEEFVAPDPIHDIVNDPDVSFEEIVGRINTVDELLGYITSFGNRFNLYRTDGGYKIPLDVVHSKLKLNKDDINRIQTSTGRFEGRLIIDNKNLWIVK